MNNLQSNPTCSQPPDAGHRVDIGVGGESSLSYGGPHPTPPKRACQISNNFGPEGPGCQQVTPGFGQACLVNEETGEVLYLDKLQRYRSRKRKRLLAWGRHIKRLKRRNLVSQIIMITLTLASVEDNLSASMDLSRFWKSYRRNFTKRGFKLIGTAKVLEVQSRGAIHYHILVALNRPLIRKGRSIPRWAKPDSSLWPWGSSRVERVRNPVGYISHYTSKVHQEAANWPGRTYEARLSRDIPSLDYLRWQAERLHARAKKLVWSFKELDGFYYQGRKGDLFLLHSDGRVTRVRVPSPWVIQWIKP